MPAAHKLYEEELVRCKESFERVDLQRERGYLMNFTTFSANVENILPNIPRVKHETMFREMLLQQMYTAFDQRCLTVGDLVKIQGAQNLLSQTYSPKIYCAYHLGSYRLLTSVLFRRGVDCVLLVGSNMNKAQGNDMAEHIEGLRQKHGLTNVFKVVESGSPSAALTILRELKAGRSLVVYVDGSPETAPQPGTEDQYLSVRFGTRRLLTRKGVAYLSHAAGVPLVPVIGYREPNMKNVLHCLKPIRPIRNSDRDMYCQEAMQQLYDAFWPYLNRYPEQWSGWSYIQSFLEPEKVQHGFFKKGTGKPIFNEDRYSICDLEESPILFDRRLYQTYEITDDLRDLLKSIDKIDSIEDVVGQEMYSELMEMEVLH